MSEVKKLTDEKTLEFDDDVVDLFVEFDEGINVPNKTELSDEDIVKALGCCKKNEIENTCAYCSDCPASDWDCEEGITDCTVDLFQKAINLIYRLQSENKTLKTELRKECEEHEEFTKKAKEEIERLTERNYWLESEHEYQCEKSYFEGVKKGQEQAVKDTSKEICLKIIKDQPKPIKEKWVEWFKKEYGVEVE